jgi:hypothetical protein
VPLLVEESLTRWLRSAYEADPGVLAWWGTEAECASAVARLEREGQLTGAAADKAFSRLTALRRSWHEIQPVDELRESAIRYVRVHDLRATDALQLAAAFLAAERRPPSLEFLCLDDRLSRAARREGFLLPEVAASPSATER